MLKCTVKLEYSVMDQRADYQESEAVASTLTFVIWLMPPVWRSQIEAHEIYHGKGLDVCLSLAIALSTIQVTVRFSSVTPNFEEETPGGSGASHLSSPSTNITRGHAARRLFSTPMRQMHYALTNTHVFSAIRTQALW
ncbi:hypothetical protein TNCV_3426571 [Trichonephila clavipes]|nr:hypothetical protein TNCV_3426571 [Trichonephila clavipes]